MNKAIRFCFCLSGPIIVSLLLVGCIFRFPQPIHQLDLPSVEVGVNLQIALVLTEEFRNTDFIIEGGDRLVIPIGENLEHHSKELVRKIFRDPIIIREGDTSNFSEDIEYFLKPTVVMTDRATGVSSFSGSKTSIGVRWELYREEGKPLWVKTVIGTGLGITGGALELKSVFLNNMSLALKDLFYKSQTAMGDSKLLRSLKNNNIVALKDYYKSQGTPTENERNSTSEKGYSLVERFDMRMDTGGFFSIDRIPEGELTTMQIRELFSNKIGIGTHVRREFTFYREFESNGIIVEESADKGRKKGKWRAENNRLCIGWSNNHAKCAKVVHKNGNIVLYGKRGIGNNSIVVTYEKFVTIRD